MKAAVVSRFGSDQPAWTETADPVPGPGQVLVEVAAASLAWGDILQARGGYVGGPQPPFIPGHDFAGEISMLGEGVDRSLLGRRVFGLLPFGGGFAERAVALAGAVEAMPPGLSFAEAAAVPASFMTADCAIELCGGVRPGETALVHAGAGGLGSAAVQLLRCTGVGKIVATASNDARRQFVRDLGADIVSGYETFEEACREVSPGGPDLCVESVGGEIFDRSVKALAPFGRLVSVGASSGEGSKRLSLPWLWRQMITVTGVHLTRLAALRPEILSQSQKRVGDLLRAGHIRPLVAARYPVTALHEAFAAMESRSCAGRIVIEMS